MGPKTPRLPGLPDWSLYNIPQARKLIDPATSARLRSGIEDATKGLNGIIRFRKKTNLTVKEDRSSYEGGDPFTDRS
ncbi:MAG: hypothetical protein ACHQ50_14430 [Fimbriimonadales bacterium]